MCSFRQIEGYPNYIIFEDGMIVNQKTHKRISQSKDNYGYFRVNLYNKQKHTKQFVHRLVAQTFLSNPNNLPQVNHINGNKEDNNVYNLEWCSAKYNVIHSYRTGLKIGKGACHIGELNTMCKLTINDVNSIRIRKTLNESIRTVFNDYKDKITFKGFEQVWYGYSWKNIVEKVGE